MCSNGVNVTCFILAPTSDQFSSMTAGCVREKGSDAVDGKMVFDCWGSGGAVFLVVPIILTVALLGIFAEEVHFIMIKSNSRDLRNSLLWILGSYPAVSVIGTIAVFMPRAVVYLSFMYNSYVTYAIYKFYYLIITFSGGTRSFVEKTQHALIPLNVTPCCCLACLHPVKSTTKTAFIAKWMIFQNVILTPTIGALYVVLKADWKLYSSSGVSAALILSIFNGLATLVCMYGFNLIRNAVKNIEDMERAHAVKGKTACIQLLMLVTGFESVIFNLMAQYDVFPCVPPLNFTSRRRAIYNYSVIIQVFFLGILARFYYRRTQDVLRQHVLTNSVSTDSVENETIRTDEGISIGYSNPSYSESGATDTNFVANTSQSTTAA